MRLRRETGDFQIKVTSGAVNTIRKGLSAEDFVGELVNVDGVYEAVVNASESEGVVTFKSASYTLTYNKTTGELTASEGGAGGSGSSGGSGLVIEGITLAYDEGLERGKATFPTLPTNLSPDDFLGATVKYTYDQGSFGNEGPGVDLIPITTKVVGVVDYSSETPADPEHPSGKEGKICVSLGLSGGGSTTIGEGSSFFYDPATGIAKEYYYDFTS